MFDALEKRFKKDGHPEQDLINHLYQGKLLDYVKCLEVREGGREGGREGEEGGEGGGREGGREGGRGGR